MDLDNSVEKTLTEIQKVMNANSIVGTPIATNDKVIIPISKTALGFGVGVTTNKGNSETNLGGAGGGGSIDPVAFVVVHKNIPGAAGVDILRVDNNGTSLESLVEGVGKTIFGFLENSNLEPATEVNDDSTIDKIKTKIKPKSEEKN